MTEMHLFRKKSKVFPQLKKFSVKLKVQGNPKQKFKSNNQGKFDSTVYKK